jgi:hypothetical protein
MREAFRKMDGVALQKLWDALKSEEIYDPLNLPALDDPNDVTGEAEAFLWDELVDQAREHDNLSFFFVVNEVRGIVQRTCMFLPTQLLACDT